MEQEMITIGSRWTRKSDGQVIRVMACSGNWLMVRIPYCMPFILGLSELEMDYELLNGG